MINTPGELRAYMELLALEHIDINDFFYGNYDDILAAERTSIDYPCFWLEDMELSPEGEDSILMIYDFSFVILANSTKEDKQRMLFNQEHTFRIAADIVARINKDSEDNILDFEIAQTTLDPINTIGNDNDQGWRVSIKIESSSALCYNAAKWHNHFPHGTIPRFQLTPTAGNLLCENKSDPDAAWTVKWRYKKDNADFVESTGSTLNISGAFSQLYIEMSITLDDVNYLYASVYLTEPVAGISNPFIYNPMI